MLKFFLFIIFLLLIPVILYLSAGQVAWWLSKLHGDYPGPKIIINQAAHHKHEVDWLFIHGASVDARVWKHVLNNHKDVPMAAISVANHEDGVQYANPKDGSDAIIEYLKTHKVKYGIVGHSTGSLWIADSYAKCPKCFEGLKIILLAPSTGSNIKLMPQDKKIYSTYHKHPYLFPYLVWLPIKNSSCLGVNDATYKHCMKHDYLYGRLTTIISFSYYNKLLNYSNAKNTQENLDKFLKGDSKNITIYTAGNDMVLDSNMTKEIAKKYNIPAHVINNSPHQMIIEFSKQWLPKK